MNAVTDEGRRSRVGVLTSSTVIADSASDAQLVDAVAGGSHRAVAEIYRRHGADVQRLAQHLRSRDAGDVVQDVFLRFWERPDRFDPARGSLRWFLLLQTRSRCLDLMRRDNARQARECVVAFGQPPCERPVDDVVLAELAADRVWSLLSDLSDGERTAIVLAYFGGHTYREVARILAQPEGTIKSRIRNGLTQLGRQMGETGDRRSGVPRAQKNQSADPDPSSTALRHVYGMSVAQVYSR